MPALQQAARSRGAQKVGGTMTPITITRCQHCEFEALKWAGISIAKQEMAFDSHHS